MSTPGSQGSAGWVVRQNRRFHLAATALSLGALVGASLLDPRWWLRAVVELAMQYGRSGAFVFLGAFLGLVVLHELSHGFAAQMAGSRVQYGVLRARGFFPYAVYAHPRDPMRRRAWFLVLLAPQVVVNAVLLGIWLVDRPAWAMVVLQGVMILCGSAADAMCLVGVARSPAEWIQDSHDGLLAVEGGSPRCT